MLRNSYPNVILEDKHSIEKRYFGVTRDEHLHHITLNVEILEAVKKAKGEDRFSDLISGHAVMRFVRSVRHRVKSASNLPGICAPLFMDGLSCKMIPTA